MFRAALLSIVLTLAAGPSAGLLCGVWCHAGERAAGACEHQKQAMAPRVVAGGDCGDTSSPLVAFVREDGRRSVFADGSADGVVVLRLAVAAPSASLPDFGPDGRLRLERRPLVLPLRI